MTTREIIEKWLYADGLHSAEFVRATLRNVPHEDIADRFPGLDRSEVMKVLAELTDPGVDAIRAVCRVFTDGRNDAILLFPDQVERNHCVNSWQVADGHAAASRDLSQHTRPATREEAQRIKELYEILYSCELTMLTRMPARP